MLRVLFASVAMLGGSAQAICLNPMGCKPATLAECRAEAAKMPTERGVGVALSECNRQFVTEPAAQASKKAAEDQKLKLARAEWLAQEWSRTKGVVRHADDALRALGKPSHRTEPRACSTDVGARPTTNQCVHYFWTDDRQGSVCKTDGGQARPCAFWMEVELPSQTIRVQWADPF